MKNLLNTKLILVLAIIIVSIITRFLPHPPNFSPIMAIALFGSVYIDDKRLAYIIPILILFFSDIFLGLHPDIPAVYISFLIVVALGSILRNKISIARLIGVAIISSLIFFLITNFSVWLTSGMYSKDIYGLYECYVMAIPFFRNSLLGDLAFTTILFGSYYLLEKRFTKFVSKVDKARI